MRGHLTLIRRWSRQDDRVKLFDFGHIIIYFVDAVPDVLNLKEKKCIFHLKRKHFNDSFFVKQHSLLPH